MGKAIMALIGLIGGAVAVVGIFLPWVTGISVSTSAWDLITQPTGQTYYYCYLALIGGGLAALGACLALFASRIKLLWAILTIGGALAIGGAVWGLIDFHNMGIDWSGAFHYGYGLYMALGGGILGLIGFLGLAK